MNILRNIRLLLVTVVFATVMGSCHIYKKYDLPDDSTQSMKYKEALEQPVDSSALGNLQWDEIFTDPQLQALITMALDNNVDLQNAKLNVDIAHAQLLGARLSYLPSITFAPNGSGSKIFKVNDLDWGYQLPLSVSWEIDIFGQKLNSKRQAQVNLKQTEAYEQATRSQIIGAVANCYYSLVSYNKQLVLYRETAELWKQTVQVMRDMKEAGRYNEVAIVQSEANYYSVLSAIPQVEMAINELNNTMSLLLNVEPQTWEINTESMIVLPAKLEYGVPMSYLAARPDVRAAELELLAAKSDVQAARKSFFPSLTLGGSAGFNAFELGHWFSSPASAVYNLAAGLTAPIFRRNEIRTLWENAKSNQRIALLNYHHQALLAYQEVVNLLEATRLTEERRELKRKECLVHRRSVDDANELFRTGFAGYLEVLTANERHVDCELEQIELNIYYCKLNAWLYRSLGGGEF